VKNVSGRKQLPNRRRWELLGVMLRCQLWTPTFQNLMRAGFDGRNSTQRVSVDPSPRPNWQEPQWQLCVNDRWTQTFPDQQPLIHHHKVSFNDAGNSVLDGVQLDDRADRASRQCECPFDPEDVDHSTDRLRFSMEESNRRGVSNAIDNTTGKSVKLRFERNAKGALRARWDWSVTAMPPARLSSLRCVLQGERLIQCGDPAGFKLEGLK